MTTFTSASYTTAQLPKAYHCIFRGGGGFQRCYAFVTYSKYEVQGSLQMRTEAIQSNGKYH